MNREELAKVFYGEGPVPLVWATDCPVKFDVWLEYADAANRRVDLILAVNEVHGTQRVIDQFKQARLMRSQPIAAGSFVSARMTLDELIRGVLPMTNLASVLPMAKEAGGENVGRALKASFGAMSLLADPAADKERREERTRQFEWFVKLLQAVDQGRRSKPRGEAETIEWLQETLSATASVPMPESRQQQQILDRRRRFPILSVTTNREATPAVTRSRTTLKADAAEQLFSVDCSSIGWAVVDSGIDAHHPAFFDWWPNPDRDFEQGPSRIVRAFDFVRCRDTLSGKVSKTGLIDWSRALPYLEISLPGAAPPPSPNATVPDKAYRTPEDRHGTHIAGIVGGHWPQNGFRGICPTIRLYDFRVLDEDGKGDEFSIVAALQAIRHINDQAGRMVIAGANLSLSVPHEVAAHSCGWTPICVECDRLTRSGVIVVAAAGNSGYTGVTHSTGIGFNTVSIADPGNTESVITVGSTHRSDPHRNGVSYFSSRGPTSDGRAKPDLLAPGEDIDGPVPGEGIAAMHGTSQAAAHVSGAAAMLVARYRELLGRPERVKSVLCGTATDLGRTREFQGSGLVDVLRAMQSI